MLRRRTRVCCAAAAFVCAMLAGGAAGAETALEGSRQALNLTASNASLEDVLKLLDDKFAVHFRSGVPLERRLNGTYSGSLRRLLADVLVGYDYIVVWGEDGQTEVIVLGSAGSTPVTMARTTRRAD